MSSDNSSSQERFTLTITGFRDESALNDTALSLSSVIKNKTREEIVQAFQALPYVVSRSLSWDSALRLKQLLEERGAILEIASVVTAGATSDYPPGEPEGFRIAEQSAGGPARDSSVYQEVSSTAIPQAGTTEKPGGVPWENRKNIGFFSSLWHTWIQVMFSPQEFFARMPIGGGIGAPLGFAIIFGILSLILGFPSSMITQGPMFEEGSVLFHGGLESFLKFSLIILLLSPIWISLSYFILGGIFHLGVLILGSRGGYEGTFRVLTYCASANVFQVIPFIGGLISGIYGLILTALGFKNVHNFSTARAVFSILFPIIVFFLFIAFAVLLVALFLGTAIFETLSPEGLNF
jgi:hypothetical protein